MPGEKASRTKFYSYCKLSFQTLPLVAAVTLKKSFYSDRIDFMSIYVREVTIFVHVMI